MRYEILTKGKEFKKCETFESVTLCDCYAEKRTTGVIHGATVNVYVNGNKFWTDAPMITCVDPHSYKGIKAASDCFITKSTPTCKKCLFK